MVRDPRRGGEEEEEEEEEEGARRTYMLLAVSRTDLPRHRIVDVSERTFTTEMDFN